MSRLSAHWWRAGSTAIVVAGVLLAATTFAYAAVATPGRQTYLQLNMCGNACNHGGMAVVRRIEAAVRGGWPYAVTLNEVCENQFDQLSADLTVYRGRFDPTGPVCDNGMRYGNAILMRTKAVELVGSWSLPSIAGGEPRRLMCLSPRPSGPAPLITCVTHISFLDEEIAAQIDAVAGITRGLGDSHAMLLGGDFNAPPADTRLDLIYCAGHGAGIGGFDEAASVRDGGKIDYVFLSSGYWSDASARNADVTGGLSDHRAVWAAVTFRGSADAIG
jgi:endonuclease/exonuclease/phosphatase family metal-dependent hydrolase